MFYASAALFFFAVAASARPVFSPVTRILFLSLRKNTERISMKFAGDNHYHEQIQ